ncbi:MAG: 30S ribosomal protein S6 [Thermodesulfobacteriota bacterium]|nr:30S ribosomal protein S6 [Thermodesulfobacteriota bacterium]
MRYYETLYLINPDLSDEDYGDVVTKFNNLVEKNKGSVINVDEWGKKTLAYKVKKFDKGYYVLLQYCGAAEILAELNRDLTLDDRVLKYQTIKLSNDVDPEALKSEAEGLETGVSKTEGDEESETKQEVVPDQDGEIVADQEEKYER